MSKKKVLFLMVASAVVLAYIIGFCIWGLGICVFLGESYELSPMSILFKGVVGAIMIFLGGSIMTTMKELMK